MDEPSAEPIYVNEHETGVTIKCRLSEPFRNRSRYDVYWMKTTGPQTAPK